MRKTQKIIIITNRNDTVYIGQQEQQAAEKKGNKNQYIFTHKIMLYNA